jgi:hypothetical protein
MKAITLQQPWASLVAQGSKWIVDRPSSTEYRGRLSIHAGAAATAKIDTYRTSILRDELSLGGANPDSLPHGAIIATCELIGSVPIIDWDTYQDEDATTGYLAISSIVRPEYATLRLPSTDVDESIEPRINDVTPQIIAGNFVFGHFVWILSDIKPVEERCPLCWGEGSWPHFTRQVCPLCKAKWVSNPVPVRGHSGLWDWRFR